MRDPVLDTIESLRHQHDVIVQARPDYRGMRAELSTIRGQCLLGPASSVMSVDVIAEKLSTVVQLRARATEFLVQMMNYATLWRELEDSAAFEIGSIRRATATRSDVRMLTEKRQALALEVSVPQELYALESRTRTQRRFAEAMRDLVKREIEQVDRAYEMVSRIETLILEERRLTQGDRSGI